jgi:hypothetical protein
MRMMALLATRGSWLGFAVETVEPYGAGPFGYAACRSRRQVIETEDPASGGDMGRYVPPH